MSIPRFFAAFLRRFWYIACKKNFWSKIWTELGCQLYFISQLFNQGHWSREIAALVKANNIYGQRLLSEGRFDASLEYLCSFRKKKFFQPAPKFDWLAPKLDWKSHFQENFRNAFAPLLCFGWWKKGYAWTSAAIPFRYQLFFESLDCFEFFRRFKKWLVRVFEERA